MDKFKEEFIYATIVKTEKEEKSVSFINVSYGII